MERVKIDGSSLSIDQVISVARRDATVVADRTVLQESGSSRRLVEDLLAKDIVMYGVNTGFGALSNRRIPRSDLAELQVNLLRSHATSVGKPLSRDIVRAIMLLRANSLLKGHSGVRPETIERLVDLLNKHVHPVIPETGSVGASGDLSPLSHMSLVLIGEGRAEHNGKILSGERVLESLGLKPLRLEAKEGLALNNGTQQMTAMGCLLLDDSLDLLLTMQIALALSLEGLNGWIDAFDENVHKLRPHQGQMDVARNVRTILKGSKMARSIKDGMPDGSRPQDPYSFRCAPQVMGAVSEAFGFVKQILDVEINSVTDNPLIFPASEAVVSGGNFHGQPVAMSLDILALGLSTLGNISERRISALLDPSTNNDLPPFLVGKETRPGLSSGLMAIQYTAAALVSENKILSHPASSDSIPTSANFEDFVSMGPGAALKASKMLENCRYVASIELLTGLQAVNLRTGGRGLSPTTSKIFQILRRNVPEITRDRSLHEDVERIFQLVRSREISEPLRKLLASDHASRAKRSKRWNSNR